MKNLIAITATVAIVALSSCSEAQKTGSVELKNETDSLSYAIGMNVATNLEKQGIVDVNGDAFVFAMETVFADDSLIMTPQDAEAFLSQVLKNAKEKANEANRIKGEEFLAENASADGIQITASGLQYRVVEEGTGQSPDANDQVTVHYTGTTIDGEIFDSSKKKGVPATFGVNGVIPGWTEGLQLMKEGDKFMFYIPQQLGYGGRPAPGGRIPLFSALVFEVELIAVNPVD